MCQLFVHFKQNKLNILAIDCSLSLFSIFLYYKIQCSNNIHKKTINRSWMLLVVSLLSFFPFLQRPFVSIFYIIFNASRLVLRVVVPDAWPDEIVVVVADDALLLRFVPWPMMQDAYRENDDNDTVGPPPVVVDFVVVRVPWSMYTWVQVADGDRLWMRLPSYWFLVGVHNIVVDRRGRVANVLYKIDYTDDWQRTN
jgi:hypothetical protein